MNFRFLALASFAILLSACAGPVKQLPDGGFAIMTTVGDTLDRSTSFVGEYDCPKDENGNPVIGQCTPRGQPKERVHGQTVAGQAVVGAMGGTGAAFINGRTARSVAEKGKCEAGSVCNGTIVTNNLQSVANALNKNKNESQIGVAVGTVPACAKDNTCGD